MALFRHVRTEFWRDEKVLEEMTPEDKLFFLYLLTNGNTTQIGVYKIPKKQMAFEFGYSVESVNTFVDRFENYYKIIKYNKETRELAIKQWGKYNLTKGGKPILDCVRKEISEVKDRSLLAYVANSVSKEDIKIEFEKYINDTYNDSLDSKSTIRGQKEKEEEKENKDVSYSMSVGKYKKLYEENVGLINGIVAEWLFEIVETVDYELFKKAIEIAIDRGKCNKGYINGILRQWDDNNIRSYSDLMAYEKGKQNRDDKNRGDKYGTSNNNYRKNGHASWCEDEDEELYRKATPEEIAAVEREFAELRNSNK